MRNFLFALFAIGTLAGCNTQPTSKTTPAAAAATTTTAVPATPAIDSHKEAIKAFTLSHPQGEWWLKTRLPIEALKDFPDDSTRNNVQFVLSNYGNVNEQTRAIAREFSKFNIGLAIDTPQGPGISIDAQSHPGGKVTVTFFPLEDVPYHPSSLWYNDGEKMVLVAAVNWPPKVFAGMLMHELYHAYRDAKGLTDKTAPEDSDVWIAEEVDAHTLEAAVLDKATNGGYFKAIDEFLVMEKIGSVDDAYKALTPANLEKLDQVFDSRDLGQNVMNAFIAEHLFVVGLRFAEKNLKPVDRRQALIKHYRTTRTMFGS